MACPITCPPKTRCQEVFGLLPRNMFTSIGSRSRMEIRSIRLLDIMCFPASFGGCSRSRERTRNLGVVARDSGRTLRVSRNDKPYEALFIDPVSPSYNTVARFHWLGADPACRF